MIASNELTDADHGPYASGTKDSFSTFRAMRRIAFLIYRDFQLLDITGPIAAFETAQELQPGSYSLDVIALKPGRILSSAGARLCAGRPGPPRSIDTLIVAGGNGSRIAGDDRDMQRFVRACASKSRRIASICTGAYVLAAAGLLDGKVATTHWSAARELADRFPKVAWSPDRIFVQEGAIWTSAGITAGIDLALALIAEDGGEDLALRTAQQLVVYHRRPGGQSQFSPLLHMEHGSHKFIHLLGYIRSHLRSRLDVQELAHACAMSSRHFSRVFKSDVGVSPAKAVERIRVDAARAALESGSRSAQAVARSCGFGDAERMRRSFLRVLGSSPSAHKRRRTLSAQYSKRKQTPSFRE